MNSFRFTASLVLALVAGLGWVHPVAAGEFVPFKGSLEGLVTITPLTPPRVFVNIDAIGEATHLGKFTLSVPHEVDRGTLPPSAVGKYNFVAANGDTLIAEFTGQSMVLAPGMIYIVEQATITGGTGRFAGASGQFVSERLFDNVAGITIGYFEGGISRP